VSSSNSKNDSKRHQNPVQEKENSPEMEVSSDPENISSDQARDQDNCSSGEDGSSSETERTSEDENYEKEALSEAKAFSEDHRNPHDTSPSKQSRYKLEPRKIYEFHKANKEVILAEVCKFVSYFLRKTPMNEPLRKIGIYFKPTWLILLINTSIQVN